MITQVRNQARFNTDATVARIRARTTAYRELEPRVIAITAVSLDQRRIILHLLVLAIVIAAAVVGVFAN